MKSINTKILITGASGNLGKVLIQHLSGNGYTHVTACYCNHAENLPNFPGVTWQKLDILDVIALEDIIQENEIIIHLAGIVSYQARDKSKILKINIEGTLNVANVANAASVNKLIHISSTAALGIPTEPRMLDESYIPDPTQFITDYALSKWYGELEVWRAMSEGLNAIILAPSLMLNPADKFANTAVFKNKIKEGLSYFPAGSSGFVLAQDVSKAIISMIENNIGEEKIILNAGNLSWHSFFTIIANKLDINTEFKGVPSYYMKLLSIRNKFKTVFGLPVSVPTAMAKQMQQELSYNGSLITELLPFRYTSLEKAIDEYCAS
ncbi:MAG TPA: NAD-dependent epimerase/dehydratase family protein [Saprospiraceae bacterium]|nr:NAD-dependent epimerase/dehydratase family protein [Saprospiraceae bacterium]